MRTIPINANDYIETEDGGLSISQDIFKFRFNGSIQEVFHLPDQNTQEYCQRITTKLGGRTIISACTDQTRGVNLYVTTTSSFKAWTWGPFKTPAS